MSEQQNIVLVRQAYDAFGRGDLQGLVDLMDPEVSWTMPGPADLPVAGTRRGAAGVLAFFETLATLLDITRFEPTDFLAQGDKVVVLGNETVRVLATGKALELRWVHVYTIANGKIASLEEIGDASAVVDELRAAQAKL